MKRSAAAVVVLALTLPALAGAQARVTLTTEVLRDKIKGGWAGQTIGVTFGGPTEFRYNGTMINGLHPDPVVRSGYLKETYEQARDSTTTSTSTSPSSTCWSRRGSTRRRRTSPTRWPTRATCSGTRTRSRATTC